MKNAGRPNPIRGVDHRILYDPEQEFAPASYQTKRLIVLATDTLVAELSIYANEPLSQAEQLVERRVLPSCYRPRYDDRFLNSFAATLELVRNLLVSDTPYVPNTAGELAARAIFTRAREILTSRGAGWQGQASELDPRLPDQLSQNAARLSEELELLADMVLEDSDVLLLFQAAPDRDPDDQLSPRLRSDERALLKFENWLSPFGNAPRPYVTYDGRAWPVAL